MHWVFSPMLAGTLAAAALVQAAPENGTIFVQAGKPELIRFEGNPWHQEGDALVGSGVGTFLYAGKAPALGDFRLRARLSISRLSGSAASFVIDGRSHFGFEEANGKMFVEGPFFGGKTTALGPSSQFIRPDTPFLFEVERQGAQVTFRIDGKIIHQCEYRGRVGWVGFRPWRATICLSEFSGSGDLGPLPAPRTMPTTYTLPIIDLAQEKWRQVVIARGSATEYQGHPTTVLLKDGKTMLAVWTRGHGGTCGPMKRSTDGGRTWSELLPAPENWKTVRNCPAIQRLTGPDGKERLFIFAGNGPMYQSVSLDEGKTWTPFTPNGLHAIVTPNTIVPISGGRLLALYHRGAGDQDRPPLSIWQAISRDGGLTWGEERQVAAMEGADPCEPAVIRSPDGKQLAALLRENARRYNSLLVTSDDEGKTWSKPVELPASLTGDRHLPRYAPDGRLVIPFRDMAEGSPTRGDFVAWVGAYDDLVHRREGQYRVHLLDSPRKVDLGYPGMEVLPDGTLVATTYAVLAPGEQNSVVSVRFTLKEIDAKVKELPVQTTLYRSGEGPYHTYRIPALLSTPRGTLLAFAEGRKHSGSDSGKIDMLLRRSTDGGKHWDAQRVIAADGENTVGNPCPVYDRERGAILLLHTRNRGEDQEGAIIDGTSEGSRTVWVMESLDEGVTWSAPQEITAATKRPDWTWYATGPGIGIQLKSGRLVIPCDHVVAGSKLRRSHVIYSDDHGATWKLGGVIGDNVNECQVIERADGSLLMNMRNHASGGEQYRALSESRDGGLTWSPIRRDPALVEPVCQASILTVPMPDGNRVFFANPAGSRREKLTVRMSEDDGAAWEYSQVLHFGPAAYSCLAALADGDLACLYERGITHPYEEITFARFGRKWLQGEPEPSR